MRHLLLSNRKRKVRSRKRLSRLISQTILTSIKKWAKYWMTSPNRLKCKTQNRSNQIRLSLVKLTHSKITFKTFLSPVRRTRWWSKTHLKTRLVTAHRLTRSKNRWWGTWTNHRISLKAFKICSKLCSRACPLTKPLRLPPIQLATKAKRRFK